MSWEAVVAALDDSERFQSRVSLYLHPLGGRPIVWHVLHALLEASPPPSLVRVLHRASVPFGIPDDPKVPLDRVPVPDGGEVRSLRAALAPAGMKVLVDGAAPLLASATVARLLRIAEVGVATVRAQQPEASSIAVAGEGPALASADDPLRPAGASRVAPGSLAELLRVTDRHTHAEASAALRDRLIAMHQARGVTFVLPATCWVDVDVRIGADTVIYPGVVIEGGTEIGSECVIGPHSRIVESTIGRGVELKGWNYVARTSVRNHAVLEPYVRRGLD
jgi:bifunctional N-acetylglucosamine-1-phosphate-uridyltransferase/glucosamine-1-phosphate-acetyltransferase GlmU-like protein